MAAEVEPVTVADLRPCDAADVILSQSPDAKKPFFRVPRVIATGGGE